MTMSGEAHHCLLQCKQKEKKQGQGAFNVVFCLGFVRRAEDENKCNTHNHLLCKGTKVKKRQRKKKVDVQLLAIDAHVIFLRSVFYNTTLATSATTLFQHRFYNTIFYNITSTLPLQCHLL
jgi:hypothetical protein